MESTSVESTDPEMSESKAFTIDICRKKCANKKNALEVCVIQLIFLLYITGIVIIERVKN